MKRKHQQQHKKRATCEICKAASTEKSNGTLEGLLRIRRRTIRRKIQRRHSRFTRSREAQTHSKANNGGFNGFTTGKRKNCPAECFHRHHRPGNKRFGAGFGQIQLRTAGALQPTQRHSEITGAETRSSGNYNQTNAGNGDHTRQLHPKSYPQHAHSTRSRWNWTKTIILTHIFVLEFTT